MQEEIQEQEWYRALDSINHRSNTTIVVGTNSSAVPRMFKDLARYHTEVHNATWTRSLPLQCTPRPVLERLLRNRLKGCYCFQTPTN